MTRSRTLSNEGVRLFLNGMDSKTNRRSWFQKLICGLYHSDYDTRLFDVLHQCRNSTYRLMYDFCKPETRKCVDTAIQHIVRMILIRDGKIPKRRHIERSIQFFTEVMRQAFDTHDYQTAHMFLLALSHSAIQRLNIKHRNKELLNELTEWFGGPTYRSFVEEWAKTHDDDILPSIIAFKVFIERMKFIGNDEEANRAYEMLDIYQYFNYGMYTLNAIISSNIVENTDANAYVKKHKLSVNYFLSTIFGAMPIDINSCISNFPAYGILTVSTDEESQ